MTRRYPIGIQTFSEIIEGKYVYIDKTDLVWQMANGAKFIFLNRPRRFGKSLLTSTLYAYFRGQKELFQGLRITELEQAWTSYPVIHLDLSILKGKENAAELQRSLCLMLYQIKDYGNDPMEKTPGEMLRGMIQRANQQTGRKVVVLVDEYDAPLLDVLHTDATLADFRRIMQEFYVPLKASESLIRFCFLTGITKFSQLSTFSTINNLYNASMDDRFAAICGITETELARDMVPDIAQMAEANGYTPEEMHQRLKMRYDGYHFSEHSEDIYNPFSLFYAFDSKDLHNYWFSSGTPTFLLRQMQHFRTDITALEHIEAPASAFDQPTENMQNALPLLYQSGYLTIKDYDRDTEAYTLAIPNQEVRIGFTEGLLPAYTGLDTGNVQLGFAAKFWRALRQNNIDLALREMQSFMASLPYVEGFKRKLEEAATAEGFYEYTLYLILSMLNVYVRTQVKCRGGRIDVVVLMPDTTYVMELKTRGTAREALAQIDSHDYDLPYRTEGRRVVKVGLLFDIESRSLKEWCVDGKE